MSTFALDSPVRVSRSAKLGNGFRHELRHWWVSDPKRWVAWLMLNPSDANHERDDPTALRLDFFSRAWGYDGWVAVNAYPLISSDPRRAFQWAKWWETEDWWTLDQLAANEELIEQVGRLASLRIIACGAEIFRRDPMWAEKCVEAFSQPGLASGIHSIGVTKDGWPIHPLARGRHRVLNTQQPIPWRYPRAETPVQRETQYSVTDFSPENKRDD